MVWRQWDIDVFEKRSGGDASQAVRGLDDVVAGSAGLLAAESVGKDERFGKLTSPHQETCAVNGPLSFGIHGKFFHLFADSSGTGLRCQVSGLNLDKKGTGAAIHFSFLFQIFAEPSRCPACVCFEWSECTRRSRAGQYHKSCATVEFSAANWREQIGRKTGRGTVAMSPRTPGFKSWTRNWAGLRGVGRAEFAHGMHRLRTVGARLLPMDRGGAPGLNEPNEPRAGTKVGSSPRPHRLWAARVKECFLVRSPATAFALCGLVFTGPRRIVGARRASARI
jgi:hypothetical protein